MPAATLRGRRRVTVNAAGARPSSSSSRSPGVASMTLVKLTFSLASVSATTAGERRQPHRAARRRRRARPRAARRRRWRRRRRAWPAPRGPSGSSATAGPATAARRGRPAGTAASTGAAGSSADLEGAPGPQVEEVEQVGAARHEAGRGQHVAARARAGRAPPGPPRDRVTPIPATLTPPVVTSPRRERGEVPGEAPCGTSLGEVVVRRRALRRRRRPQRARRPESPRDGCDRERGHGAGGQRGALEQRDRLAAVVGPLPAVPASRRSPLQADPGDPGAGGAGRRGGEVCEPQSHARTLPDCRSPFRRPACQIAGRRSADPRARLPVAVPPTRVPDCRPTLRRLAS